MSKISDDNRIQNIIAARKVITIDVLASLLNSSIKTARRRLKLWQAYTSYNQNGRFYTLPDVPEFDAYGCGSFRTTLSNGFLHMSANPISKILLT